MKRTRENEDLTDIGNLIKSDKVKEKDSTEKYLAVLVPMRGCFEDLLQFVPYMSQFLSAQQIPFHIFVIHETDTLRFNRAALLNIGFMYIRDKFDYIALHDVDLLPLNPKLSYGYPQKGVFQVAEKSLHPFMRNTEVFLGAITIFSNEVFEAVNGMCPSFWGWGGEDRELHYQLKKKNIEIEYPKDIGTNKTNTFRNIHSKDRVRDKNEQRPPKSSGYRHGLNDTKYRILDVQELTVDHHQFTLINTELFCNKTLTPWCVPQQ